MGVPRADDRCVLIGIFWVMRSCAPWRDLPERCASLLQLLQPLRVMAHCNQVGQVDGRHHRGAG